MIVHVLFVVFEPFLDLVPKNTEYFGFCTCALVAADNYQQNTADTAIYSFNKCAKYNEEYSHEDYGQCVDGEDGLARMSIGRPGFAPGVFNFKILF